MFDKFLPRDPRLRAVALAVAALAGLLIITQFVLPGDAGGSRGTPMAIVFRGLIVGAVVSLFATGIVLIYRTLRIINFAQGPIGTVGVILCTSLFVLAPVPFPVAFLIGMVLCAVLGAVVGTFLLRFFNSSRLFLTVVTVVGATVFLNLIPLIQRLPFYPAPDRITTEQAQRMRPGDGLRLEMPFPGFDFTIGDLEIKFGFGEIFALELVAIALLGVFVFLRYTRAGVAIRALAENPERASLLGIGVGSLTIIVWVIVGVLDFFGAAGAVAGAPTFSQQNTFLNLIPPLAAAAIGRFRNLPVTVYAAVLLGIAQESYNHSYTSDEGLFYVVLLVIVLAALLAERKGGTRSERVETSWAATTEPRPVPKELAGVTPLRVARISLIVVGAIAVLAFPWLASVNRVNLAGVICIQAIAVLSLVVLTGWAGQISLGQYAFVAVGSVVGGALTESVGIPFWFALPIGAAITAAIAVLVGLPALRVRGLFLLVTTFIFAVVVREVLFDETYFGWLLPDKVERPTLFFLDFEDERSMYFLCVACLVLAIVVVQNLRRSRVGRVLIAMRENEANVQAFGVSAFRMKLTAFAIAGALAGFAGVLFAHQARGVADASFDANDSVQTFIAAVVGGVSSPGGSLLGSAYFQLTTEFQPNNPAFQAFLNAGGPLIILFIAPGGLISLVNAGRDSVLRIVAQRRRIVVPSLFADYDPELLDRQLIPLGEPDHSSGLAALPTTERFVLRSELYKGKGERIIDKLGPAKEAKEAAAIGAAARSFSDAEEGEVL